MEFGRMSMSEHNDDLPECWPRIGDRLFVQNCGSLDANIATFRGERIYRMKKAYKNAADLLVAYTEKNVHERCNLVWPIVFCYRQYIELALKDAVNEYGGKVDPKIKLPFRHEFKDLWPLYKRIICSVIIADEVPEISAVEACIYEFEKIDSGSYTFRYPTNKKGAQIDIPYNSIDLFHIQEVMEGIYNFLDCSEEVLDAHFNPRQEG